MRRQNSYVSAWRIYLLCGLVVTVATVLFTPSIRATTVRVPTDQPTIQAGVDAASESDTVLVASGTYTGPGNYNILMDGKGLVIRSESGPAGTIIDCESNGRAFQIEGPMAFNPVIEGLTIKNGQSSGGGIYSNDQSVSVLDCAFMGNAGNKGGALQFQASFGVRTENLVSGCTFYTNSGLWGVYYHRRDVNTVFEGCVMVENTSRYYLTSGPLGLQEQSSGPNGSLTLSCCNLYGNFPLDWYGLIGEQALVSGNFSQPPLFCDPLASPATVHAASPLLAENNTCGVNIGAQTVLGCTDCRDDDEDGLCAVDDNCPLISNLAQLDADLDGIGDACEDEDGDGLVSPIDNCPLGNNPFQEDIDSDGLGDVCDDDIDGDGYANVTDNCPVNYNPGQEDYNDDGTGDICCCVGRPSDANGISGDEPTIGDISVLIDAKFITGTCDGILGCLAEADVNQSGGCLPTCSDITIGDISLLIHYL